MSSCRSCHQPVEWVELDTGKRMPLDVDPVPDGNVVVLADGRGHVLAKGEAITVDTPRRVSHFATCPNAAQHRRR